MRFGFALRRGGGVECLARCWVSIALTCRGTEKCSKIGAAKGGAGGLRHGQVDFGALCAIGGKAHHPSRAPQGHP